MCDDCRAIPTEKGKPRKLVVKSCLTCGREYRTRARNNYCRACLHQSQKHPCEECAAPCDKRAIRCLACLSASAPSGTGAANWKGGRAINRLTGYVKIRVPVDHPRGPGYVSEHVWVMEQHLGRFLVPGESVHHKNGQRDDNRLSNLELWAGSQPSGQRAADLLAWAREIIDRYGPEEERLR